MSVQDSQVLGKCPHPRIPRPSPLGTRSLAGGCCSPHGMGTSHAGLFSPAKSGAQVQQAGQGRAGQGCSPGESAPQGSVESVPVPLTCPKSKPSGLPLESTNKSPSGIPLLPPGKSHLEVGLCQQRLADEHSSCCHRRHEGRLLRAPPHPRYTPRTTGALYAAHGPHRCEHKGQAEFMPPFSPPRLTFGMDFKVNTSSTG